jgi:hypothetical protein
MKLWWSTIPPVGSITKQSLLILTHWIQKNPQHMTLEIYVLTWDRHNNVVGLNWLMGYQSSLLAGVDVTAGPWPVYLRSGQSNWTKIGPLGQLIFLGHLGQQLSFLPCHSISTDNRLMKFPDKTLKFNFNHSLFTQRTWSLVVLDSGSLYNGRMHGKTLGRNK